MVKDNIHLHQESEDFDKIYRERYENMRSITLKDDRIEEYFYKNPWRYRFTREYAFQSIIDLFFSCCIERENDSTNILEIGCGNGWFSINANADNRFKFTSIDISPEAISIANDYARINNVRRNQYMCSSLEDFKVTDKYDFAVCINSLHHFTDLNLFAEKTNLALKRKGQLFVYDVCPDRFDKRNASYVLLIELILSLADKYYSKIDLKNHENRLIEIMNENINETEGAKQSVNDHFHDSESILRFLKKKFTQKHYSEHCGILTRLIGGIRGEDPQILGNSLI